MVKDVMQDLVNIVQRRLKEAKLFNLANGPLVNDLYEFIIYCKVDIRLYALTSEVYLEEIWNKIRENEDILDFVMGIKTELHFLMGEEDYVTFITRLARAYAHNSEQSVMDDDTFQRLPVKEEFVAMLKDNDWVIPVFLLSMADIELK